MRLAEKKGNGTLFEGNHGLKSENKGIPNVFVLMPTVGGKGLYKLPPEASPSSPDIPQRVGNCQEVGIMKIIILP